MESPSDARRAMPIRRGFSDASEGRSGRVEESRMTIFRLLFAYDSLSGGGRQGGRGDKGPGTVPTLGPFGFSRGPTVATLHATIESAALSGGRCQYLFDLR